MRVRTAFSIIELLVLLAIVALLIALLMPALGRARDMGLVARSKGNLRQISITHAIYAADHNDQQWSNVPHDVMSYGPTFAVALDRMAKIGQIEPHWDAAKHVWRTELGWAPHIGGGEGFVHGIYSNDAAPPINMHGELPYFGSFRLINVPAFNLYLGGRFYDAVLYAPKDRIVIDAIGECFDSHLEFCALKHEDVFNPFNHRWDIFYSSYILSPAAMYSPQVFSLPGTFTINDLWKMPAAFRSPTFSQARYPDLKTHMIEHHWLQNARRDCMLNIPTGMGSVPGCEPYRFNASIDSAPVTLFYDGHIGLLSVREALDADAQAKASAGVGLWHDGTPLAGDHYHHGWAYTPPGADVDFATQTSSYHVLTRGGILGRDTFAR